MMMGISKWIGAMLAITLMVGTVAAADTVSAGKIKSINADNKTFVLTDEANKDSTYKLGENVLINRDSKESKSDLKVGDSVNVCYDKGLFTWTAHYILVQEGATKSSTLVRGNVKAYDAAKQELNFTDESKTDSKFVLGKASVRLNMAESKIEDIKIGDHALLIVETVGKTPTLRSVMVDRK